MSGYVEPRFWTDDTPMHAAALLEVSDSYTFERLRGLMVPTGVGDDTRLQFGQVTIDTALAATATAAVTFATAMPESDPCIIHTPIQTTIYGSTHESVSASGFTMRIREIEDRILDVNIPVNWWAIAKTATGGGTSWAEPRRWAAEALTTALANSEWGDKPKYLKKRMLEVANAVDEGLIYRHGAVTLNGKDASFSEEISLDFAFGTLPNVQAQVLASTVFLPFVLAVSPTGFSIACRHINETSVSVKNMKLFWLAVGGAVGASAPAYPTIKTWTDSDIPTGADLTQQIHDPLDYFHKRKVHFFAATDEGKHLEFGQTTVAVASGSPTGSQAITFDTAFGSVTPTPKASAESVEVGKWFGFVSALSSSGMTLATRQYQDANAASNLNIVVNWVVVG